MMNISMSLTYLSTVELDPGDVDGVQSNVLPHQDDVLVQDVVHVHKVQANVLDHGHQDVVLVHLVVFVQRNIYLEWS